MSDNKYNFTANTENSVFQFISTGSTGTILKRVQFKRMSQSVSGQTVFNLALGDVTKDDKLDDKAASNNHDILIIISTVSNLLSGFTESHPADFVHIRGNTDQKTNLYNRSVLSAVRKFPGAFEVFVPGNEGEEWKEYDSGMTHSKFLIRKNPTLFINNPIKNEDTSN